MLTTIFISILSAGAFVSGFVNHEPGGRRANEKARKIGSAVEEARRQGKSTPYDDEGDAPVQTPKNEREARHEASKARVRFVNAETGEVLA